MLKFAVIENGIVRNLIVAETQEIAEQITGLDCVYCDGVAIGWTYDAETKEFAEPVIEEAPADEAPTEDAAPSDPAE